jgi:hypothetical protein
MLRAGWKRPEAQRFELSRDFADGEFGETGVADQPFGARLKRLPRGGQVDAARASDQ